MAFSVYQHQAARDFILDMARFPADEPIDNHYQVYEYEDDPLIITGLRRVCGNVLLRRMSLDDAKKMLADVVKTMRCPEIEHLITGLQDSIEFVESESLALVAP